MDRTFTIDFGARHVASGIFDRDLVECCKYRKPVDKRTRLIQSVRPVVQEEVYVRFLTVVFVIFIFFAATQGKP